MHVAHEPLRPYVARDCKVVLDGINDMNENPHQAARVVIDGAHESGHPLPGVWTVHSAEYGVDFRAYASNEGKKHLWAEVYRQRQQRQQQR